MAMLFSSLLGALIALGGYTLLNPQEDSFKSFEERQNVRFSSYAADTSNYVVPEGLNFVYAADVATPGVVHIRSKYSSSPTSSQGSPFDQYFREFFGERGRMPSRSSTSASSRTRSSAVWRAGGASPAVGRRAGLAPHVELVDALLQGAQGDGSAGRAGHDDLAAQVVHQGLEAERLDLIRRHPAHQLGHVGGRRHADGAALTLEGHVGYAPRGVHLGVHDDTIRAAGVAAGHGDVRVLKRPAVAGILIVIYQELDRFLAVHRHAAHSLSTGWWLLVYRLR